MKDYALFYQHIVLFLSCLRQVTLCMSGSKTLSLDRSGLSPSGEFHTISKKKIVISSQTFLTHKLGSNIQYYWIRGNLADLLLT